ncbi:MAG: sigma 54-interacting transcriptional regulator, partial [Candidatus Eisenbacteria sp.]|nr:sigma 54-interacting transcriptional regulator [Candidatus Eisenbacteria bacterium]
SLERVDGGERVAERYQRLLEIAAGLIEAVETDQLLSRILDAALEMTEAERGLVLLRDEGTGALDIRQASTSMDPATCRDALAYSDGIVSGTIQKGRTLLCADAAAEPGFREHESVVGLGILSLLCIPLRAGHEGRIVGTLYLDNRNTRGVFTPQDVSFLEGLAGMASLAISRLRRMDGLRRENIALRQEAHQRYQFPEVIGNSPGMQQLFLRIRQLLVDTSTVLITGETGTGKEVVARAIHFNGPRKSDPFLALDCAALSESLLESELFGHVRGAFTNAYEDKPGLFEAAGSGTVLLDDIGQMSPAVQSKLLRVLQEREVRRVGAVRTTDVRARILCATNEDLREKVRSRTFREDLYYRISVIPLEIPPLRDRREDIPLLAGHFLRRFCREKDKRVSLGEAALDLLCRHDWPGNVRQLEHEIEKIVVFAEDGETILPEDLSEEIRVAAGDCAPGGPAQSPSAPRSLRSTMASYERYVLRQALALEGGNISRAAKRLGLTRQGLQQKMKRLALRP